MAVLKASLADARGRGARGSAGGRRTLDELSKDQLYDRAQDAEISGRSIMNKDQLIEALEDAS